MHAVRGIFVALGLSLVSFTLSSPARAQSAEAIAAAKKDFADGIALEEQGKFAQALVKFRSVAKVKETPQILFHVGLCESKTGALVEATQTLRRAVDTAHAEGNDKVESAAQGELDAVEQVLLGDGLVEAQCQVAEQARLGGGEGFVSHQPAVQVQGAFVELQPHVHRVPRACDLL